MSAFQGWSSASMALLISVALLGACREDDGVEHDLIVNLRTDLVAAEEFDAAQLTLTLPDGSDGGRRLDIPLEKRESFLPAGRLGEMRSLAESSYRLDVLLRDRKTGRLLVEHPVLLDLRENLSVTVPIDRSCLNIGCPPKDDPSTIEDESAFIACLGGQCIDPRCTLETPEFCGDTALCTSDNSCEAPSTCARGVCQLGVCWAQPKGPGESGACRPAEQWCAPELGCLPYGEGSDTAATRSYRSCQALFDEARAQRDVAPLSGEAWIDPDGVDGAIAPFLAYCDQEHDGGGWTRLFFDDFERDFGNWSEVALTNCGPLGRLLGPFGEETPSVTLSIPHLAVPHTEIRITGDVLIADSWDGETIELLLDNDTLWSQDCWTNIGDCNKTQDLCGGDGLDGVLSLDVETTHSESAGTLSFVSNLNSDIGDESWSLDNIAVFVR